MNNPALGQVRISNELKKKGFSVSTGGVRSIWLRHILTNFPNTFKSIRRQSRSGRIYHD